MYMYMRDFRPHSSLFLKSYLPSSIILIDLLYADFFSHPLPFYSSALLRPNTNVKASNSMCEYALSSKKT